MFDAVFINNMILSGIMVWVDAALFLTATILLVDCSKRWLVVALITGAHAFYGFLGLLMVSAGNSLLAIGLPIIIGITSILGFRFIIEGLDGDEAGEPADDARVINLNLVGLAAIGLYSAVSIDELYAVLQRYQWMAAQGWEDLTKAANIGGSMVVLFALLGLVKWALEKGLSLEWLEKNEDRAMFTVFSLIMYYIVRGIVQNGFGYVPLEIPFTGIAPELLIVGFALTWMTKRLMQWQPANLALNKLFFLR